MAMRSLKEHFNTYPAPEVTRAERKDIMKYLGMEFKNYEELQAWSKQGHIDRYKWLAKRFAENGSMETSCMMSKLFLVPMNHYGMTSDEIEALELEVMEAI